MARRASLHGVQVLTPGVDHPRLLLITHA